jgi:glycerophosphoryl diester phosphodiesterase
MPRDQLPVRRPLSVAVCAAALALSACEKIDYIPPNPVAGWPTKVLMHRGGGSCGSPYGSPCPDNTLPAILHGLSTLDGAEMDIQLSKDRTLWLGHDNEVLKCDRSPLGACFQDLADPDIDAVAYCNTTTGTPCTPGSASCAQHYVRLDEVFAAVAVPAYADKLFSLDVKGQYCGTGIADAATVMADEVNRLVRAHGMDGKVLVESDQRTFVERVVANATPVYSFVVALDDVDGPLSAAARLGATGISFKYAPTNEPLTAAVVDGIHGVGHRIIVWVVNDPADIAAVWATRPDVVETDNPDFRSLVPP